MTTFARKLLASGLALLAPIAAAVVALLTARSLPDPLPVHWNFAGVVDNTAGAAVFIAVTVAIAVVLAAATIALVYRAASPPAARLFAAMLTFGAWLAGAICVITLAVSSGADSAQGVALPWYGIACLIAVPAAFGAAVWALLPGSWPAVAATIPGAAMRFAPGERVVWVDHCGSIWARWAAVGAAVLAVVALVLEPMVAIPLALIAIAGGMLSEVTVRIDSGGVHTLWGPLGWPRSRVVLADIAAARSESIEPMQWGGWGYRVSKRGVAVVIRRGPGLVVSRSGKPDYAVTIPRAAEGAEVLAALLARAHAGGRP